MLVGGSALLWLAAGCADQAATGDIVMTAGERPDIDRAMIDQGVLVLPSGRGFNIHVFSSQQSGDGRGESKAQGNDGVLCEAVSGEKGTARAGFQLGYAFDNTSEKPLDAEIRIRLKYNESIKGSGAAPTSAPAIQLDSLGHSGLSFLIRDTNGATMKSEAIIASHPIHGRKSSESTQDQTFDARFEPSLGYYIFLSGHIDAAAVASNRAEVRMEISKIILEIKWQPAGDRRAALDANPSQVPGAGSPGGAADGGSHGNVESKGAPQP